ncbi:MFS transporter [Streptomyces sp. FXJ1.4098]|nr:MFS transporter [Streptomyces sp. FXJ1.4098]
MIAEPHDSPLSPQPTRHLRVGWRTFLRLPYSGRLLAGGVIGGLPHGMTSLTLLLVVREEGGSYALAGVLVAVFSVGVAAGQPLLGRAIDRMGQTRPLVGSATVAAAAYTILCTGAVRAPATAITAATIAGLATPPLDAALRELWRSLMPTPETARAAHSLGSSGQQAIHVTGPLLVAAISGGIGAEAALLTAGLTGLIGTLMIVTSPPSRAWRPSPARATTWSAHCDPPVCGS